MPKNPKYQSEGKDYSPAKGFHDADLDFNLPGKPAVPGPVKGAGTPVSAAAFKEMQSRYVKGKKKHDTEYITFGREAILSILSQFDCAGIKFYFVERHDTNNKQLTLAMVGVDEKNNDLVNTVKGVVGAAGVAAQDTMTTDFGTGFPPSI